MTDPNFPAELLNWLDGWGGRLKDLVTDGCKQAWATCTATVHSPQSALPPMLRVGTDCSGIEAPVHALLGLGLPHQHMWSSEAAEAPRKVSLANTRPEKMFTDVVSSSQGEAPAFVELYVSGFSCKPFSTLHHQSKLLQEDEAEVFFATVDRIHQVRPSCFVLENVMGIRRVAAQVQHHLVSSGLYTVIPVEMDPADLGEPVQRPRLYFLGVRKDVALAESAVLTRIVECAWHFVKQQSSVHSPKSNALLRRLLPASHPAVEQHQKLRKERWLQAGSAQTPTGPFI